MLRTVALVSLGVLLFGPAGAVADTVDFKTPEDGFSQMRANQAPAVLFFSPGQAGFEDTDQESILSIFKDRQTLKLQKKRVIFVWLPQGAEQTVKLRQKYELADAGVAIVVIDLIGGKVDAFTEDVPYRLLSRAVKSAEGRSKKQAKQLKALHKAAAKADQLKKVGRTDQAIPIYQALVEVGDTLDPELYAAAQATLVALKGEADEKLKEIDKQIDGAQFPQASKALNDLKNAYPFKELEPEIRKRRDRIAQEVNRHNNP